MGQAGNWRDVAIQNRIREDLRANSTPPTPDSRPRVANRPADKNQTYGYCNYCGTACFGRPCNCPKYFD